MKVKYLHERWDLMKTEIHKGSYIIYGKLFCLLPFYMLFTWAECLYTMCKGLYCILLYLQFQLTIFLKASFTTPSPKALRLLQKRK